MARKVEVEDSEPKDVEERIKMYLNGVVDAVSQRAGRIYEPSLEQYRYQNDYDAGYERGKEVRLSEVDYARIVCSREEAKSIP